MMLMIMDVLVDNYKNQKFCTPKVYYMLALPLREKYNFNDIGLTRSAQMKSFVRDKKPRDVYVKMKYLCHASLRSM